MVEDNRDFIRVFRGNVIRIIGGYFAKGIPKWREVKLFQKNISFNKRKCKVGNCSGRFWWWELNLKFEQENQSK